MDSNSSVFSSSSAATNDKVKKIRRRKTIPKVHRCNFCGKECPTPAHLEIHLRTHTGEKPFSCPLCPFTTGHKQTLVNHKKLHNPDHPRTYKCSHDNCNYAAKTIQYLHKHAKSHLDMEDRAFKCNFCPYRGNSTKNLGVHIRSHTKEKPFKCQICLQGFSTQSYLKLHHRSIHYEGDYNGRPFPCTFQGCSYRATTKRLLKEHLPVHVPRRERNEFKCEFPDCSKTCTSARGLKAHQLIHTSVEKKFKCPVQGCGYKACIKYYVRDHMKAHSEELPFVCKIVACPFKSKHRKSLSLHMKRIHAAEGDCENFSGDLCGYKSKIQGDVQSRNQRAPVKPTSISTLTCPYPDCEYKTPVKRYLIAHAQREHGDPTIKYRCSVNGCPFTHSTVSRVKIHERGAHGEKFKCPEPDCEFSTSRKPSLSIHRQKSHGPYESRPFKCSRRIKCDRCPFSALRGPTLGKHLKDVHGKLSEGKMKISGCKATPHCEFRTSNVKELAMHLMDQHDLPRVNLVRLD